MTKVAEVIRFYSLNEITAFIEDGGEYPLHHIWHFDQLRESGLQVDCIEFDKTSLCNKIGEKLRISNLQQQIECLKQSKEIDIVFAPFISDILLLAGLKLIGLYKTPIVGLAFETYNPLKKHFLKKLRQKILRSIYINGIDSLIFINEKTYNECNQYKAVGNAHTYSDAWGVDFDFFFSFIEQQKEPPKQDYIYTTGGTVRDFETLFEAFKNIDFDLKITTRRDLGANLQKMATPNIIIDNSIKPGLNSVGLIRKEYYNSLAVAIPLGKTDNQSPNGLTVLMESFAMGKPVISTHNKYYPFNIEKEKVGLYVDLEDPVGWIQATEYLINNPNIAREMGERAQYLSKTKYNYKLFSKDIINQMDKISLANNIISKATKLYY